MGAKRKFVIDTDGGVDDAQAILMALACPDVDVIAITTTHGNTDITNVCKNILRLLRVAERLDIPVYKGADKSMMGTNAEHSQYHGTDGFGDVTDDDVTSDRTRVHDTHAVDQLIELANQHPGEITLVALGPLTNIALASRLQPEFGSKLKQCVCMGGNYEGQGNITQSAEFNFHSDPEAAYIVLNQLGCTVTLVCWELCLKYVFSWESYEEIRTSTTVKAEFLKAIERKAVEYSRAANWPAYIMCDELAMTVALQSSVVKGQDVVYATVETRGITRGQMVVDWTDKLNKPKNVAIVKTIDKSLYRECVERAIK